jgi:hypothetical protein
MKSAFLAIIVALFLTNFIQAQSVITLTQSIITVKSIRSVPKSKRYNNNKPYIEIELHTPNENGFHIGGLYWCLYIGTFRGIHEGSLDGGKYTGNQIRLFTISKKEWKQLKNGDPMHLSWGCSKTLKDGQPIAWDYTQVKVFAYLDKRMLSKK